MTQVLLSYVIELTSHFSDYPPVSWKRAQPAPLQMNKNSAGLSKPMGGATHGRTDWAAK